MDVDTDSKVIMITVFKRVGFGIYAFEEWSWSFAFDGVHVELGPFLFVWELDHPFSVFGVENGINNEIRQENGGMIVSM